MTTWSTSEGEEEEENAKHEAEAEENANSEATEVNQDAKMAGNQQKLTLSYG